MLRIGFAAITTQLLQIVGLLLVGGILLLWVCWKMWRELRAGHSQEATDAIEGRDTSPDGSAPRKTFAQAAWLIVVADVSMSLDNVLAVAGAARDHLTIMIFGLILSIAMMGLAATYIAPPAAAVSLDRLCRPRDHPLCRAGDDLPGSP